jgi:hypothetical protein
MGAPKFFASSPFAQRSFCRECGTPLTFQHDHDPNLIDITTCSLDNPSACAPEQHIYVADKLDWVELADQLPKFAESSTSK